MRQVILLTLIQVIVLVGIRFGQQDITQLRSSQIPLSVRIAYENWLEEYKYHNSNGLKQNEAVYEYRLNIFYDNLKKIERENSMGLGYEQGINQFMDLTDEEWIQMYISETQDAQALIEQEMRAIQELQSTSESNKQILRTPINWVTLGYVNAPENQLRCNSSYAFAGKGVVEAYYRNLDGRLSLLSAQQIIDCAQNMGVSSQCSGGVSKDVLNLAQISGLVLDSRLPYTGHSGSPFCSISSGPYKISGYNQSKNINCTSNIDKNLEKGPVAAEVDAINWKFYKSGIFKNCATTLTQSVLVVGVDQAGNYLARNSWGTTWGENGFITLAPGNTCGICSSVSWAQFN